MARRTFSDYKDGITHAIGNTPASGITTGEVANDALQALCSMRPWRWLRGGAVVLDLTADQDYVELPQDFGEIEVLTYPGTISRSTIPTTVASIELMRAQTTQPASFTLWYAVNSGTTEADFNDRNGTMVNPLDPTAGLSINLLEIYPTPTETVVGALNLTYLRNVERMEDDADIPAIPTWMDYALFVLGRAMAHELEDDEPNSSDRQTFNSLLPQLIQRDSQTQHRMGVMRGGLYPGADGISPMYPTSIGDPTST